MLRAMSCPAPADHYRYPLGRCQPPPATRSASSANRTQPTRLKAVATGAVPGQAYPNPTQAAVTVPYRLPAGTTTAEVQVLNLLTGHVQLTVPLQSSDDTIEQKTVQLPQLPAGQYMYRLLVNGQPVAVPQRLVTLP